MAFFPRAILACALAAATPVMAQTTDAETTEAPAAAAVSNGQQFGAWTVNCVAVAVGETNCTLTQRVLRASDGAFVADVLALQDPEGQAYLLARVPIGASLPTGFAMREENTEEPMQFAWQVCTQQVCEALYQVDEEMVAALSAEGNTMIAAFRPTTQAEPFVFQLSLSGMKDGLAALRK